MISKYVDKALRRARYVEIEGGSYCGTVTGLRGVLATASQGGHCAAHDQCPTFGSNPHTSEQPLLGRSPSYVQVSWTVWQKYPSPLAEQYPQGPQSESIRQWLPTAHTFGALLDAEGRHAQGTFPEHSESE
jgi:hypothetical protein